MLEEEHTDREHQLAMLCQKLDRIKTRYLIEDETDNINQAIGSNSPETCLAYLMDLEKKGDPHLDPSHLTKLTDFYTRVFSTMPLGKHCKNESYARMLVRFAELNVIQETNGAEDNFNVATTHCQDFAFVHIAHAQFELSQGNTKKSTWILQRAIELSAKPNDLLEAAMQNLTLGKAELLSSEDKENVPVSTYNTHGSAKNGTEFRKVSRNSDGTSGLKLSKQWNHGMDPKRTRFQLGVLVLNEREPLACPEPRPWKDMGTVDSTTTLLHRQERRDDTRMEDTTDNINQIIGSNSPEACRMYLTKLEKRGNPQTDTNLLLKLKDSYSRVFSRLPLGMYSNSESYAKMLVRYAELKGIDDPDDARDNFIVARSNCKSFAFVHIAHAQFEVARGQVKKGTSILQKALQVNAKPTELIETAMQKLKAGNYQFLPAEDRESLPGRFHLNLVKPLSHGSLSLSNYGREREPEIPTRLPLSQTQPKPSSMELSSGWKIPAHVSRVVSPEEKHTPPDFTPIPRLVDSLPTPSLPLPSRLNPPVACQMPNYKDTRANSYFTPGVKRNSPYAGPLSAAHKAGPAQQQPCTPLSQVSYAQQTHQGSAVALSNESIVIKGKRFLVLKMIGQGGSSKVYQVLDQRNQLFAVKYVNLEEADAQTVESYKNEIEHLNRLQQYSDQIIKLYDYEITNSYIYILMECGNLDLSTWLRNRKTVNPLERKLYWKNMLEAVQTIHKHGIVHSDLKPANFVIVNASLKLIDFGIANCIQPDVTSIMTDSQVGTLNYMPPEAIKDTSSQPGKASSKISTKGDVWSLGCIMYCMTYGKTPFQTITNQITKLHAIIDPTHEMEFPDIAEKDLLDVLKRCLVRNPRERISIAELLEHSYLKLQSQQQSPVPAPSDNNDLKRILNELAALQSPNSIARAANNLAKMCNSGRKLDAAGCVKSSSHLNWKM
ncbi:dual specificity protein kinase Ttk-like [Oncorhynchus kisutch]|uniref:dual specificity protein kinase Ttk-like n=1 Tax=Oncorhynchus kisutch TaxID=8019 RepID=UPI0012DCBCB1|nr:dual specificity protein kinase Ttk-like [Oncorhynchus kisutch]